MRAALRDLWNGLLGRERIPRNPDEAWVYIGKVGRETGELEAQGGIPADTDTAMHPVALFLVGFVTARIANLSRRLHKRLSKFKAVGDRQEAKAERYGPASAVKEGVVDFFASRVLTYLIVYGLTIGLLETTGMVTSSIAYETALGEVRIPMSVAAGAILVLAGHVSGHLIDAARKTPGSRRGYLAGAVVVLALGALTVGWLGVGRDANTEAVELMGEAGGLRTEASRLDRRAGDLLRPLPGAPSDEPVLEASAADRRAAKGIYEEAEQMRRRATLVDGEARDKRTLAFLAPVQLLGLAVGTAGGFFFAGAGPIRERRRASRHRSRAAALGARADGMQGTIDSLKREEYGWAIACYANADHRRRVARGSITPDQTPSTDEADLIRRMTAAIQSTNGASDTSHVPDPEKGE